MGRELGESVDESIHVVLLEALSTHKDHSAMIGARLSKRLQEIWDCAEIERNKDAAVLRSSVKDRIVSGGSINPLLPPRKRNGVDPLPLRTDSDRIVDV